MATSAPAGSLAQAARRAVIGAADDNSARRLLLEVASETKIGVAGNEHLLVHRSMRIVTGRAAFANRFMFENKRPALCSVTLTAGVVLGEQRGSATAHGRPLVRIMAIAAAQLLWRAMLGMTEADTERGGCLRSSRVTPEAMAGAAGRYIAATGLGPRRVTLITSCVSVDASRNRKRCAAAIWFVASSAADSTHAYVARMLKPDAEAL